MAGANSVAAKTLLQMAGADPAPASMINAALVLIDYQNEYVAGPIAVRGAQPAIAAAARLLADARRAGAPVFHIAHKGRTGGMFDRAQDRGQIVQQLTPASSEAIIEKGLPNAFAGTSLQQSLARTGRKDIIIAGFMTHMCVSSTARVALDLGFRVTVPASACATRDLPDGRGHALSAEIIHEVALVELADRFAIVTWG